MEYFINLKKNYSISELTEIYGPLWAQHLGLYSVPKNKNKKEIFVFEDFDTITKSIYKKIFYYIFNKNSCKKINMWAVGSRVLGTWKTKEEAEELSKIYNLKKIKYSDYDFITDAELLPSNKEIQDYLYEYDLLVDGIKLSVIPNARKVLIPFDNL